MTPTTQTNQPDDRCEQIAREIVAAWGTDQNELSPPDLRIVVGNRQQLTVLINAALQAAKQQGREEGKSDIESLQRQVACQKADYETTKELLERCTNERLSLLKQQPKSEPSRECVEIANDLVWTAKGRDSAMVLSVAAALQTERDKLNALREEVLGVIEPFATWATAFSESVSSAEKLYLCSDVHLGHCRAALALRDKLKASQPTLPQQQTPHQ